MKFTMKRVAASALMAVAGVSYAQKGETVKIAFMDPLSGPFANVGQNQLRSWQMVAEKLNAKNPAGVKFEVVPQATAVAKARPAEPADQAGAGGVRVDEDHIRKLREKWQQAVSPHDASLRQAATTHYEVITQLRREQQRLIDEADKIQRLIDELEKQYQDMTTPRPE